MIEDHSLFEVLEEHAILWLPESPERRVRGKIFYSPDRVSLEVYGELLPHGFHALATPIPVVLGKGGAKNFTLIRSIRSGSQACSSDAVVVSYRPEYILVGMHVGTIEDLKFSRAAINFTGLEHWIADRPFDEGLSIDEDGSGVTVSLTHRHEAEARSVFSHSLGAEIGLGASSFEKSTGYHFELTHRAYLQVTPAELKDVEWFLSVQTQLRRMLSFFADAPVRTRVLKIEIRRKTDSADAKERDSHQFPEEACLLWRSGETHDNSERLSRGMLVTYPDIKEHFDFVIDRWFSNANRLNHVYNLFFGTIHRRGGFLEQDFLQLTQALEVFSRVTGNSCYLPEEEYETVATAIKAAIPHKIDQGLRDSLRARIKYGNQFSLRKRIGQLISGLQQDTVDLFTRNPEDFVKRVVDTRNYFVHLDEVSKEDVYSIDELPHAIVSLHILIAVLLMRETGFAEEDARTTLQRSALIQHRTSLAGVAGR